jgi:hypothetical protein
VGGSGDDIAAFAAAAARIADPFVARERVLRELGMSAAEWHALERRWREAIAQRAATGDSTSAREFARTFAAERERLRAARGGANVQVTAAARTATVDATADAMPRFEPALPFRGQNVPPGPSPAADASDGTVLLEGGIPDLDALPWDEKP